MPKHYLLRHFLFPVHAAIFFGRQPGVLFEKAGEVKFIAETKFKSCFTHPVLLLQQLTGMVQQLTADELLGRQPGLPGEFPGKRFP